MELTDLNREAMLRDLIVGLSNELQEELISRILVIHIRQTTHINGTTKSWHMVLLRDNIAHACN